MHWKSVLEIDLNIIRQNYRLLKELTGSVVTGVLKASSYGLGATEIAPILLEEGCNKFFLANIIEGLEIRSLNPDVEVFVLDGVCNGEESCFIENNLIPVLSDVSQMQNFNSYCQSHSIKYKVALHIDTGMNRFGIQVTDLPHFLSEVEKCQNLDINYVMSHLASSEELDNSFNSLQRKKFESIIPYFKNAKFSIANSGGILLGKEFHYDFVRPGAALYGINVRKDMSIFSNPVRLFSTLAQIKEVQAEEGIGYNLTYKPQNQQLIGTLFLGYADGISRALSNNGKFYIKGFEAPIVGRVSMDYINIDLSKVPLEYLHLGQEVELINQLQTPDILAESIGTIGYEILTSLGNRYERIYIR